MYTMQTSGSLFSLLYTAIYSLLYTAIYTVLAVCQYSLSTVNPHLYDLIYDFKSTTQFQSELSQAFHLLL